MQLKNKLEIRRGQERWTFSMTIWAPAAFAAASISAENSTSPPVVVVIVCFNHNVFYQMLVNVQGGLSGQKKFFAYMISRMRTFYLLPV